MLPCDELLDHLEDAAAEALPPHLAEHIRTCGSCRRRLDEVTGLRRDRSALSRLRAPAELVARLKATPRLAPACDAARS